MKLINYGVFCTLILHADTGGVNAVRLKDNYSTTDSLFEPIQNFNALSL